LVFHIIYLLILKNVLVKLNIILILNITVNQAKKGKDQAPERKGPHGSNRRRRAENSIQIRAMEDGKMKNCLTESFMDQFKSKPSKYLSKKYLFIDASYERNTKSFQLHQ